MNKEHRQKVNNINLWSNKSKFKYGYIEYYNEYSEEIVNQIYDLIVNDKIDLDNKDSTYIRYLGCYYFLKDDLVQTKKYFEVGVNNDNSQSMLYLAMFYFNIENDITKSKELFNRAVEKGNQKAMYRLAIYYANNVFNDDKDFANDESNRLLDNLVELKNIYALDFYVNYYMDHDVNKSREYINIMLENGYMSANFDLIKLGCSYETEKQLLSEIVGKWEINRCTFEKMDELFDTLSRDNVETKYLLEHCIRLGFDDTKLRIKFQSEETIIRNKMNFSKDGECPVCFEDKRLIPFDCFGHFYCLDCDKKMKKCGFCRIPKNLLTDIND
jgi:hypothetical protein